MSNTLGPLPHPVEVSRYTKGEELRITHAYTTAQMEAERQRCYALGVAQERERAANVAESYSDYYNTITSIGPRIARLIRQVA